MSVSGAKAVRAGREGGAEAGDEHDFLLGDAGGDKAAELVVAGIVPEAPGFDEGVGEPEVGVGGGVVVEDLPFAGVGFAPVPGGQAGGEIAGGEVGFGPVEELVEVGLVVVDEGEEHGVGLAFAGGAVAGGAVDDAALGVEEALGVGLPERPGLLGVAAGEADEERRRKGQAGAGLLRAGLRGAGNVSQGESHRRCLSRCPAAGRGRGGAGWRG